MAVRHSLSDDTASDLHGIDRTAPTGRHLGPARRSHGDLAGHAPLIRRSASRRLVPDQRIFAARHSGTEIFSNSAESFRTGIT
jgi:hypothetical protein